MTRPKRIQSKRTKLENAVYVGRSTKWANPFRANEGTGVEWAVREFSIWLNDRVCNRWGYLTIERDRIKANLHELRGKNLACSCPLDQPCHADELLRLANKT